MSEAKPVIFLSHASDDKELAELLAEQIRVMFGRDTVKVFVSSEPDAIGAGDKWFPTILQQLEEATALVVLLTPNSIDRRWVWFEIGYFWRKVETSEGRLYPLHTPSIKEIPHPLNELQAKSLKDREQLKTFASNLKDQFGFGEPNHFDTDAILTWVTKPSVIIGTHNLYTRRGKRAVPRS